MLALERMGYEFVPDTESEALHLLAVGESAEHVREAIPSLIDAFGGSPRTAELVYGWLRGGGGAT